jgi:hypothetical protein
MIKPQTVEKEREESRMIPLPKHHRDFGGWGPRIG